MPEDSDSLLDRIRRAARQEQFLDVLPEEEARRRFAAVLDLRPLEAETVPLAAALDRVVARTVAAAADAPPFDRSSVDGFALRAADTIDATEAAPVRLRLNREVLACGVAPTVEITPGTATAIATGGMIPRGADAVAMIEWTEPEEAPDGPHLLLRRAVAPGGFVAFAGSDIARGEALLRAGAVITSREIGMLAAAGHAEVPVVRRPRVAVLSTGDELHAPGTPPPPGGIPDSNAAILCAAVAENGGEPVPTGIFRDEEAALAAALRDALARADVVVMSGGTSKGAGDVSHRVLGSLGSPGVVVHGVALKPGKPLLLAVVGRTPVIVLPGFPTSAVFTFHEFAAIFSGNSTVDLLDPKTGEYNTPFVSPGLHLVPGWLRMQGVVFRPGDARFAGLEGREAVRRAAADPSLLLVNRNAGSGTRILLDGLLGGARPAGYANQPKSHNAVAAAVEQGRADWGVAIATVARDYGLGFLPLTEEHYDLFVPEARLERPPVRAFLVALAEPEVRTALTAAGFKPAPRDSGAASGALDRAS